MKYVYIDEIDEFDGIKYQNYLTYIYLYDSIHSVSTKARMRPNRTPFHGGQTWAKSEEERGDL